MKTLNDYFDSTLARVDTDPANIRVLRGAFFGGAAALLNCLDTGKSYGEAAGSLCDRIRAEVEEGMRESWPGYAEEIDGWRSRN